MAKFARTTSLMGLLAVALPGCSELHSNESALNPAGPAAAGVSTLTWLFIAVSLVVYVLVMVTLIWSLTHGRKASVVAAGNQPIEPDPVRERRAWTAVFAAIVVTVVTLFVLLIGDFATGRALHSLSQEPHPLYIKVIGHQWWWEVKYLDWPERFGDRQAYNTFSTANEIHLPVDPDHPVMVKISLESHDVIHSFWLPNLAGKHDLIPGHPTEIWLRADRPGTYYGECAEYCGYQHANMRLVAVAEPIEQFQAWLAHQRQPAAEPATESERRGRDVMLHSSCVMCHSIQGTEARGLVGPNLTHVFSRPLLAAGAITNTRGNLAGWVVDAQRIKPGTQMPQNNLAPGDLLALLDYLESLK